MPQPFTIHGQAIRPGTRTTVDLPVAQLHTHTPVNMPVQVVRGRGDGPRVFVSAAIHGDELNGVEIIRRVLRHKALKRLRGTLVAVPIVNVHGVLHHSRYLPDRRDLNRSFPGSERGSLAARLAHLFMTEVVGNCDYGIDLHTGAIHRGNLPQIRADLDDPEADRLAKLFGVPVLLNSALRDGSLRQAAGDRGVPVLLYEAGEALRFDEFSIRVGVRGVLNVLRALGMLRPSRRKRPLPEPYVARSSNWVRAPQSGFLRTTVELGALVKKGDRLGVVSDPFGEQEETVKALGEGIVVGRTNLPLVNEGDGLFHIARFKAADEVAAELEAFQSEEEAFSTNERGEEAD
ncbi:MAG: succinylglutamate desuccinylase/aspartoacylase family protein [Thiohalorhabdus sp.]|uniref:succinylglutamate desuccinylase/aspartoacylase family protein n=1 Tax=Thiohalorhabdus sp. TaxID=3094134 RepID=UPI0039815286